MKNLLLVGLGGMLGTIIRYVSYIAFGSYAFPYVTLIINITGSFIIGVVTATALKNTSFADWRLFLATGLCGGFTTFSAFSMETLQLLQQNRNIAALMYVVGSVGLGIVAAFSGFLICR
jgi:CrcB protein